MAISDSLAALYSRLTRRACELLDTGAISKAGKPPRSPEDAEINRGWRAWDKAIKELPSDQRRELDNRPNINERDVLGPMRTEVARGRAGTRRINQLRAGGVVDPGLAAANIRKAEDKATRLRAIAAAVEFCKSQRIKPTAKRVTQHINAAGFAVSVDTVRKDLAQKRRDDTTG
jgi:hypothetical protein